MISLPWFKKCMKCESVLPLFMFRDNPSKYKVKSQKGKNFNCNRCNKCGE